MGPQGPHKNDLKSRTFQGPPSDPKMEPKWSQNGAKMEPKWIQNGTKIVPNWIQNGATIRQVLNPNPSEMNTKSNEASIKLSTQTQPRETIFLSVSQKTNVLTGGDGRPRATTGSDGRRRAATGGDGRREVYPFPERRVYPSPYPSPWTPSPARILKPPFGASERFQ